MNNISTDFTDFIFGREPVKCKCGNEEEPEHPCPYSMELSDFDDNTCNCCDNCQHQCSMDI